MFVAVIAGFRADPGAVEVGRLPQHLVAPLVELVVPLGILDDEPGLGIDPLGRRQQPLLRQADHQLAAIILPRIAGHRIGPLAHGDRLGLAGRIALRALAVGEPEVVDHDFVEQPGRVLEDPPGAAPGWPCPCSRRCLSNRWNACRLRWSLRSRRPRSPPPGIAPWHAGAPRAWPGSRRGRLRCRPWSRPSSGTSRWPRRCRSSVERWSRTCWAVKSVEKRWMPCLALARSQSLARLIPGQGRRRQTRAATTGPRTQAGCCFIRRSHRMHLQLVVNPWPG